MDISAKKFTIELTQSELWQLACDFRRELLSTVERHWVHHQSNWKHNEKERIEMLRVFFYSLGRPDMFEEFFEEATKVFGKFNSGEK